MALEEQCKCSSSSEQPMFLLNRREGSPNCWRKYNRETYILKNVFQLVFFSFQRWKKANFPTGALLKSLQPESEPETELEKKSSLQNAQTSTRIHHKPFPAFSSHIIFLQSENNTLKTPSLLYLNWYSHSFQKTYFHSPRASGLFHS